MCKFIQVIYDTNRCFYSNLHYIPQIRACYLKFAKYLEDDFAKIDRNICSYIESFSPYFWAVLTFNNQFMGFVGLDNLIGGRGVLYSADLTTCFEKEAWGDFTRYSAKIFLKKAFDELGLRKINAQIYPDNFRVKTLLKSCGFVYETTLKSATLRGGVAQDFDVYALYRSYYYKNEVKL